MQHLLNWLNKETQIAPLVIFRLGFGLALFYSTIRFMIKGWVDLHFVQTQLTFSYYGFDWVEALPASVMYGLHVVLMLAAIGVTIGLFYRLSSVLVFLLFTYFHTIDVTYYLNHYYFVSLVSFILIFLPASQALSVDNYRKERADLTHVPRWTLFLLMFQVGLVYFYAGIAKLNYYWLIDAMPLKIWLPAHYNMPIIGSWLAHSYTPYVFSWIGMLFDVSIVGWLLWKRTSYFTFFIVVVFHALTGLLFQIGVFPLVMPLAASLFLPVAFHQKLLGGLKKTINSLFRIKLRLNNIQKSDTFVLRSRVTQSLVMGYMVFQLLFPFRYLCYTGNLFWREEGYRFSWRVMLMEKAGTAQFYIYDANTGKKSYVDNTEFLNPHQEKQMAMQPDLILQFAHFLADHYEPLYGHRPQVKADVYVTLNGKPSQLLVNPDIDLASVSDSWERKAWVTEYLEVE